MPWIHQTAKIAGMVVITNATGISVKVEVTRATWSKIIAARWTMNQDSDASGQPMRGWLLIPES
jgi:hypothetical protein